MRKCLTKQETIDNGGQIIHNSDGSVTVYNYNNYTNSYYPVELGELCCSTLDPNYIFDIDTQTCRWSDIKGTCDFSEPINILVNPKGNDGSLFFVDENEHETCTLDISFDYLIKIKCEDLLALQIGSKTNSENQSDVNKLTISAENIQTQIESVNNEIILLNSQLVNTPYSIECDSTPIYSEPTSGLVQTQSIVNFEKTGFGSKTVNLVPDSDENIKYSTVKIIYCLTSYGLQQWESFLGPIKFQAFINGDSTAYTCKEVNTFINGNYKLSVAEQCNIPFGTRTKILNDLTELGNELTSLQLTLIDTNKQSSTLETKIESEGNSCLTAISWFENLDISMALEVVNEDNSLTTVFETPLLSQIGEGNLYTYLTTNQNSGFYVCGGDECTVLSLSGINLNEYSCDIAMNELLGELYDEAGIFDYPTFFYTLSPNAFASSWLTYSSGITDSNIIDIIKNKKIKLSLKINNACGDFCVLMDNIVLDKNCSQIDKTDIQITKNPGFDFKRVIDNKKSWVDTNLSREFIIESIKETNSIRQTEYNINDERLVLNSKEIDLDINIATAIETDVWHYIVDNPCLLTGETFCSPCLIAKNFQDDEDFYFQDNNPYYFMDFDIDGTGTTCCGDNQIDFNSLLTSDLSTITTVDGFVSILGGELIDVKNRQTISSYATLRALYERYLNSIEYCNNNSSGFDYYTIDQFAGLIGNYWVDIIEQVIPATTIWGSVKIYTNTIFDEQKFKYKAYSSLFCENKFFETQVLSPINGISGVCENVNIIKSSINTSTGVIPNPTYTTCNTLCIAQMNYGSEFIGTVSQLGSDVITEPIAINCVLSQWGPWSPCSGGTETRTRTIVTPAQNGGTACGPLSETRACSDCVLSDWSSWSVCSAGTSTRTRTIISPPQGSGAACGSLVEYSACTSDCVLSDWSEFGPCDIDDMRTRTRTIITPPFNGGAACGPLSETVDCILPTIKTCYYGLYPEGDITHPSGGTVTYINEMGLTVTESFIWDIDTITIFAWDVISISGVSATSCNDIISISNDAEGEPDCHNSITVVVDTDTLVKVDIISNFACGATYDTDLPLGFGVVGVYADLIDDTTSVTKFYNYGIEATKTFTSGDTCTSSITINVKDSVDDGLLDTYTFYRIHNSDPHC